MRSIDTLGKDIAAYLASPTAPTVEAAVEFGSAVAEKYLISNSPNTKKRAEKTLYFSEIGTQCNRQLAYKVFHPELGTPISPEMRAKFLYGDIIEEYVLSLATHAGHTVEHRQKSVEQTIGGWKIRGRIDAYIDGALIDVKSTSPYGFKKFQDGLTLETDTFGYIMQVNGYRHAETKVMKDVGFVVMDKQNGNIDYFSAPKVALLDTNIHLENLVAAMSNTLDTNILPNRGYELDRDTLGNGILNTACSYCAFKKECWSDVGKIRTFQYYKGPMHVVKLVNMPRVREIT